MVWSLIQNTNFRLAVKFILRGDCGVTGARSKPRLQKQVTQDVAWYTMLVCEVYIEV